MTIGVDVDDTITKTTEAFESIPAMNDELFEKIVSNPDDYPEYTEKMYDFFMNMKIYDNVVEVINYLQEMGNKIVIVTARGSEGLDELVPITKKFFDSIGIHPDEQIYNQYHKGKTCSLEHVDVMIDDNEYVLDDVARYGIKTIRFSEKKVYSNHLVLNSWKDIKKYIRKMGD